jgi:hypothetical protein
MGLHDLPYGFIDNNSIVDTIIERKIISETKVP